MKGLLVTLVVLLGLAVVADRVAVHVVEDRVGQELAAKGGLQGAPDVQINGFPFLTQVISGTYEDVRISLTAADLGQPEGTSGEVALRGVHVPLSDAVAGSVREVPVDRIDGTATLSYTLLSAQLGGNTTLRRAGDGLQLTKTVKLAGQSLPVRATGTVALDGDVLAIHVDQVSGVGVEIPGFLVQRVSDLLDIQYTIPPLPFGLHVTDVRPGDDGVVVTVRATDAVLRG